VKRFRLRVVEGDAARASGHECGAANFV
jgi:hypothetical protein